jgi:hypothetical protein
MTGSDKLLIVNGCATVAEERQGDGCASRPDNKKLHCKAKAISRTASRRSGFAAHAMTAEPDSSSLRAGMKRPIDGNSNRVSGI